MGAMGGRGGVSRLSCVVSLGGMLTRGCGSWVGSAEADRRKKADGVGSEDGFSVRVEQNEPWERGLGG